MGRLRDVMLGGAIFAWLVGPALADTSRLGGGYSNWFYNCANDQTMNVVIRHADRSTTEFSLQRGETVQEPVQPGDMAAWRCGAPVDFRGQFRHVVKTR